MKLILASGSRRRQDIFNMIGLKYEVVTSDEEENSTAKEPGDYVKELSRTKANSVAKKIKEKAVIVSADTIVYMDGKTYEKPKSKEEAFNNLKEMSGKATYAYTGTTIKDLYQNKEITFCDICKVYIKNISDEDIRWYVENQEYLLDISGYAMMGKAAAFLDKIEGDHNALFGISPSSVYENLKKLGYKISDFN